MADNYLERKMEDYRRGTSGARRLTHTGDVPGVLRLRLQPRAVLILDAAGRCDDTLVSMLTGAGCRVAFTCADASYGHALAQRVGALYLPAADGAVELLMHRWRTPKVAIWHSRPVDEASDPTAYSLRAIADIIEML